MAHWNHLSAWFQPKPQFWVSLHPFIPFTSPHALHVMGVGDTSTIELRLQMQKGGGVKGCKGHEWCQESEGHKDCGGCKGVCIDERLSPLCALFSLFILCVLPLYHSHPAFAPFISFATSLVHLRPAFMPLCTIHSLHAPSHPTSHLVKVSSLGDAFTGTSAEELTPSLQRTLELPFTPWSLRDIFFDLRPTEWRYLATAFYWY